MAIRKEEQRAKESVSTKLFISDYKYILTEVRTSVNTRSDIIAQLVREAVQVRRKKEFNTLNNVTVAERVFNDEEGLEDTRTARSFDRKITALTAQVTELQEALHATRVTADNTFRMLDSSNETHGRYLSKILSNIIIIRRRCSFLHSIFIPF